MSLPVSHNFGFAASTSLRTRGGRGHVHNFHQHCMSSIQNLFGKGLRAGMAWFSYFRKSDTERMCNCKLILLSSFDPAQGSSCITHQPALTATTACILIPLFFRWKFVLVNHFFGHSWEKLLSSGTKGWKSGERTKNNTTR